MQKKKHILHVWPCTTLTEKQLWEYFCSLIRKQLWKKVSIHIHSYLIITNLNLDLTKVTALDRTLQYLACVPRDRQQTLSLKLEKKIKICFSVSGKYVGNKLTSLILRFLWPLKINVVTISLNFSLYGHCQRLRYLKNNHNKPETTFPLDI